MYQWTTIQKIYEHLHKSKARIWMDMFHRNKFYQLTPHRMIIEYVCAPFVAHHRRPRRKPRRWTRRGKTHLVGQCCHWWVARVPQWQLGEWTACRCSAPSATTSSRAMCKNGKNAHYSPGFTKSMGTGLVWPVTGQTGPARFRFGPVPNRPKFKI